MEELMLDKERTVVIVSHDTNTLQKLCTRILWIHEGKMMKYGEKNSVLEEYIAFMHRQ